MCGLRQENIQKKLLIEVEGKPPKGTPRLFETRMTPSTTWSRQSRRDGATAAVGSPIARKTVASGTRNARIVVSVGTSLRCAAHPRRNDHCDRSGRHSRTRRIANPPCSSTDVSDEHHSDVDEECLPQFAIPENSTPPFEYLSW